ncbi:phospholipase D family protein [Roseateles sp.]|uniref:phospholipase D family protein n=1 Tax=Roseateles sp. TaxID=1971397 RepID=UPI0031DA6584
MSTTILSAHADVVRVLIEQTNTCISASWAVAWATPNEVFDAAIARMNIFKHLIVGTHGSQTHPKCLRALASHPGKAFIRRNSPELFHPKIYMFEHADRFSIVIGSHNLTRGAFECNDELSILTDLDKTAPSVKELLDWMAEASRDMLCVTYTPEWLAEYERLYELGKQKRKEIDDLRKDTSSRDETNQREGLPINLTWDEFYEKLSQEMPPSHDIERRLVMLDYVAQLFRMHSSYAAMPKEDRMRVAGLASQRTIVADRIDWDYFGSMKVAQQRPDFKALVVDEPEDFSGAIDNIPLYGPVNEIHWRQYWTAIRRIDNGRGSLGFGLATRIAALRRPDVFVSINFASKRGLARFLDRSASALVEANYWKGVIQEVQRTRWYVAAKPRDPAQARVWNARAALLDSLVYET